MSNLQLEYQRYQQYSYENKAAVHTVTVTEKAFPVGDIHSAFQWRK